MTFVPVRPVLSRSPVPRRSDRRRGGRGHSGVKAEAVGLAQRLVGDGAGGVGRAVLAVGAAAEDDDVAQPVAPSFASGGQDELLIATALAVALRQRHRRFAAATAGTPAAPPARRRARMLRTMPASDRGDLPRFAFDERAEVEDAVAQLLPPRASPRPGRGRCCRGSRLWTLAGSAFGVSGTSPAAPRSRWRSTPAGTLVAQADIARVRPGRRRTWSGRRRSGRRRSRRAGRRPRRR